MYLGLTPVSIHENLYQLTPTVYLYAYSYITTSTYIIFSYIYILIMNAQEFSSLPQNDKDEALLTFVFNGDITNV